MNVNTGISSDRLDEKYAKIFQLSSNLLSVSTLKDGQFIEVNDAFLTTLGFAREEIIGKTALELGLYVNPDDRQKLLQATEKGEHPQNIEIQMRAKDGAIHYGLFSADKISINNEKCWLVSITDISALKQAENALWEHAARYRHIVEDQSELICRYQADGKISFVNEAYARYFGKSRAELVGRNFIPHIPEPDLALISRRLAGITRDNPDVTFEHRVIMPGGDVRWQQWNHRGIYTADGHLIEYQAVGRDITDFKRAEQIVIESAEDKFKIIFDNAYDGILLADLETKKFVMANNEICRMLGYSPEEMACLGVMDIHPEKDHPYVTDQFKKQARGELKLAKDMPLKRKDGSVLYTDINASMITMAGKKYLAGFFRDITDRKQAEAELSRAHNQLKNLIDSASQVSIIATDCSGKILTFNSGAERMLGYSAREMVGKQTPLIIHLESEVKARGRELTGELGYPVEGFEVFVVHARRGEYEEREWTYVKKDGQHITIDLIVTSVKDAEGQIIGFLGIAIDITARKLAIEAQAASAAKSQFVANISHEIRTPLNGIIGICELLLQTKMSNEQIEYAQIIDSSAETLLNIINATLDFSKIEAGKMALEHIDFNLRDIVEDIVSVLAVNASKKKLEMISFIEPEVPVNLNGAPNRLRQILFNLVGNAIKFTSKGEIAVNVALVEEKGGHAVLRFSVRDTGIGIPADKTKILFKAFAQIDASLSHKAGGTGLGLAIARGLTEQMGGSIGVESDHGKGSTFWFVIPFLKQNPEVTPPAPDIHFEGARILVVDDNETNRQVLARQLQSWKINVATAANGKEALAKMRSAASKKEKFTAVITDQRMPEMDGVTLGQAIKTDAALKNTVLLMASSMTLPPETYIQNKHLFAAMLIKPIRQKHLFYSLFTALKGKKMSASEKKWVDEFRKYKQYQVGNRLKILVAEDNIANQQVTLNILENMGHLVHVVANGREAVKALEMASYDLVLMDVQMPEMDGMEATALIRDPKSRVRDHDIPILALTAYAMESDREKCLAAGMNGYITKPVSIKSVADAIANISAASNVIPPYNELKTKHRRKVRHRRICLPYEVAAPAAENGNALHSTPLGGGKVGDLSAGATVVFDAKAFSDRLRGKSAPMSKIINITLDETPKLIRKLEQAVKKRQQENAGRLIHNLRGGAANVSGNQFLAVAVKLETAGNAGDWREAENILPELNRQFEVLRQAMREFQKTLK